MTPARLRDDGESGAAAGPGTVHRLPGFFGGEPRVANNAARRAPRGGSSVYLPQDAPTALAATGTLPRGISSSPGAAPIAPATAGTLQTGVLSSQGAGSGTSSSQAGGSLRNPMTPTTNNARLGGYITSPTNSPSSDDSLDELIRDGAAEATVVGVVRNDPSDTALHVSVERAEKKGAYIQWPLRLARRACALRGIKWQSREANQQVLAKLLTALDVATKRETPFYADLYDEAAGKHWKKRAVCLEEATT